jgi:quercetin dioxygenase-like cupin family protein
MGMTVLTETQGEIYDTGLNRLRILARGPEQAISIMDSTVPPGFPGPVRHRHAHLTDIFYVLDGQLEFELDGERQSLGPGSFVLVPPGVVHTFRNPGSEPARMLNIFQPSGFEQYLVEAFRRMAAGNPWSPAEMAEIASRYDFEPVVGQS